MSVTPQGAAEELQARLVRLEHELKVQRERMAGVQEIGAALGSTLNLDKLLRTIMDKITEVMQADRSTLFLLDEERAQLWSKIAQGGVEKEIRIDLGQGMAGWVAKTGQSLNIKDAYQDPRFNQDVDVRTGYRTRSMLCLPMRNHRRKTIGVVQVLNKHDGGYFTLDDELLLSALCSQAAISIENSKLYLNVVGKNIALLDTQAQLKRRVEEIDVLFRIEQNLNRQIGVHAFLGSLLQQTCEAIPSGGAAILLREGQDAWQLYAHRTKPRSEALIGRPIGQADVSLAMRTMRSGEELLSNDLGRDQLADDALAELIEQPLTSVICVPLEMDDQRLGAIQVFSSEGTPSQYTPSDLKMLTVIAGRAEAAILLAQQRDEESKASRLAAIGQALSGVLHDLKTPMTVIGGYTQLMVDEEEPEERQQYAETITRQLKALKRMTAEILGFARGEANLLMRKVFLHTFMPEIAEGLRQELTERGVDFSMSLDYRDGIRLDTGKIERAIFNLARNARQAMGDGGSFRIATGHDPDTDEVIFRFQDSGPGIPENIRHNLFESFVTSGKEGGTGLGLAIVKEFVEQHGGTIDFETEIGVGTTFIIRLPRNLPAR